MEKFGPFSPDSTNRRTRRSGTVVGVEPGVHCERVAAFRPLLGASPRGSVHHERAGVLLLAEPVPFFAGESLALGFEAADGLSVPADAEAWLLIEWGPASSEGRGG